MSGPCTDCGGPDYQTLEVRIAELEAENEEWIGYFDAPYTDMCHYKDRAVQAEAVASSSDTLLGEATRWAKDARERAEQAEATIERLKVCGNCAESHDIDNDFMCECWPDMFDAKSEDDKPTDVCPGDPCHYAPSRWEERGAP